MRPATGRGEGSRRGEGSESRRPQARSAPTTQPKHIIGTEKRHAIKRRAVFNVGRAAVHVNVLSDIGGTAHGEYLEAAWLGDVAKWHVCRESQAARPCSKTACAAEGGLWSAVLQGFLFWSALRKGNPQTFGEYPGTRKPQQMTADRQTPDAMTKGEAARLCGLALRAHRHADRPQSTRDTPPTQILAAIRMGIRSAICRYREAVAQR